MKKMKLVFLTFILCLFYSCSDENSVQNDVSVEKSMGLRTVLQNIKKSNGNSDRTMQGVALQNGAFLFDFVYPITLSYNNGTTITVNSFEGLLEILANENENQYIDGIAFPFQVVMTSDSSVVTINNEEEFWNLINSLEMETMDDYLFSTLCYDFVFPFSVINQNNQTLEIANEEALLALFTNPTSDTIIADFVYPFSVIYNDETLVINDVYEFFELNNVCFQEPCNCPTVYNPVCVATPGGVIEYPNDCYAACDGFTTADFVNCNPNNGSGFELLGTCFVIEYPVQVQYQGAVITVNNDTEFLSYINSPNGASVVYPIVINHATSSLMFTINSQQGLLDVVSQLCF